MAWMDQINWVAVSTIVGAAIVLGRQLQVINQLREQVADLATKVAQLTSDLTRFATILEERTRRGN